MSETERKSLRERRRAERKPETVLAALRENKNTLIAFGVIVSALVVILISMLALSIPVVPVCVIVVLEAGLALCLHDVPIWLHVLVALIQVIAGILCGAAVFMVMCAALYFVGIAALLFTERQ